MTLTSRIFLVLVWLFMLSGLGSAQQPALQITSPADGAVVNPGQTLSVLVDSPAGTSFSAIALRGEDPIGLSDLITSVPGQFDISIPADIACRRYFLEARGLTASGQSVISDPINIDVERPDLPLSLTSQLASMTLEAQGETTPIMLLGAFPDGSVLNVTASSNITYGSTDPTIVRVDQTGMVTAIAAGSATIVATYTNPSDGASLQLSIPVTVQPFVLTATPSSLVFGPDLGVTVGASATLQVTLKNTTPSDALLSVLSIDTGGDFSETDDCLTSSPLPLGGTCIVSVTFTPTTQGERPGDLSITTNFSAIPTIIPLDGAADTNFDFSVAPFDQNVSPGSSVSYAVTLSTFPGFTGTVSLAASGLPAGVTATFSPSSLANNGDISTLTLTVPAGTPPGNYDFVITAVSGILSAVQNAQVSVAGVVLTATPTSQIVPSGAYATYTIGSTAVGGFAGDVSLAASGLPIGTSATFNPPTISGGAGSSTLTVTTSGSTPIGNSLLLITGTGGATANVNLGVGDFAATVTPTVQTVSGGASGVFTIDISSQNGFFGDVTLSTSALPPGFHATFSPQIISGGSGSSTLTIIYDVPGIAPTSLQFSIVASSNGVTHTTPVTLTIQGFTLTATPATQQVIVGDSATYTVTTTAENGFTGTVTLSTANLPTGSTATFSPATITGSGTTTLTLTTSGTTTALNWDFLILGTSGIDTETATASLSVADFNMSITPTTQTVTPGSSTSYSVTIAGVNGFSGTVTPSVSGLPAGATATFNPTTITGSGTTTLTLTTTSATPVANSTLTVTGASGVRSRSTSATLAVTDFTITATPTTQTVTAAGSTSYTVTVAPLNGFTGTVTPSVTGLPAGATASFSPATITGGAGTTTMTVATTSATPGGSYTLTVNGTSGADVQSATVALGVSNFTLSVCASVTVQAGNSATCIVTVTAVNGFTGTVTLSSPQATFNPPTITGSGTSTMTIPTSSTTAAGNYIVTVVGTSGADVHSTTVALSVTNFTLGSCTQLTVLPGGSVTCTVTVTALNGFTGTVTPSVSGLPTGATASFSPTTVTGSGTTTLTVTTSSSTPAANSTLTIRGTSGADVQTTTATLSVVDFNISVTPASQTVTPGGSTSYTMTVTAVNGFTGTVTPSVTGLPAGATATFSPATITGGAGTSTMTVATTNTTSAGTYSLTVSGTSSTRVHNASVTLTVQAPPDFSIAVSPAAEQLIVGGTISYNVTITASNGFTGVVTLSAAGAPTGASVLFSPSSITGSGTSNLAISVPVTQPLTNSTLTISGTSGSLVHTATATLSIVDVGLSFSPTSQSMIAGDNSTTYSVIATALNGFAGVVTPSVSGLPTGVTASFTPSTITGGGTFTMTVVTTSATPVGTYTLSVSITAGTRVDTGGVSLTVEPLPDFTLSLSPTSQSVYQGGSVSYAAAATNTTSTCFFSGGLPVTVSGLPAGATYTVTPGTNWGTSTVTIVTSTSTPVGTYTLTMTASGCGTHSGNVSLTVAAPPPPPPPPDPGCTTKVCLTQ